MSTLDVTVDVKARVTLARVILWCSPVIGAERAVRWAQWAVLWRSRWRIRGQRWQRFEV